MAPLIKVAIVESLILVVRLDASYKGWFPVFNLCAACFVYAAECPPCTLAYGVVTLLIILAAFIGILEIFVATPILHDWVERFLALKPVSEPEGIQNFTASNIKFCHALCHGAGHRHSGCFFGGIIGPFQVGGTDSYGEHSLERDGLGHVKRTAHIIS